MVPEFAIIGRKHRRSKVKNYDDRGCEYALLALEQIKRENKGKRLGPIETQQLVLQRCAKITNEITEQTKRGPPDGGLARVLKIGFGGGRNCSGKNKSKAQCDPPGSRRYIRCTSPGARLSKRDQRYPAQLEKNQKNERSTLDDSLDKIERSMYPNKRMDEKMSAFHTFELDHSVCLPEVKEYLDPSSKKKSKNNRKSGHIRANKNYCRCIGDRSHNSSFDQSFDACEGDFWAWQSRANKNYRRCIGDRSHNSSFGQSFDACEGDFWAWQSIHSVQETKKN